MKRFHLVCGLLAGMAVGVRGGAAQDHRHGAGELGTVNFPVSCNPEARNRMNTAVAMLHSFWFPEARGPSNRC